MLENATPAHTDLASRLPADAYSQLIRTLRLGLPPPLSDSPEDLTRRDHAAIAQIAALVPANAAEADLAALYVAASEQVKECLRLAQQPDISADWAMKCRAQANSMMRQGQSALRLLLLMQAAREKREANSAANERAAWSEHCAIGLMAQALSPPEKAAMTETPTQEPLAQPEMAAQPELHSDKRERRLISAHSRASGNPVGHEGIGHAGLDPRFRGDERNWSMTSPSILPDRGRGTGSVAGEGATLSPEFPSRSAPLTPPSPPASAGGEGEMARSLDAVCDRPWRPPDGTHLDRRFAEAPARLAYSETRQP